MILAERAARLDAEAQITGARLEIERLKLLLAKARREQYGQSSERGAKIIAQLELQLAELEETAAEAETAAEIAASAADRPARPSGARKPARRPLPEHLPRERVVYPAPCTCPKCGSPVRKLGEDVTETLECVPRRWKVVEHVREKVSCRCCEAISQPPAPSHPIARGRAGPHLLALVLAAKYGQHLPLTRQSAIYAREGVEIDVSTLADWVGAAAASLMPLVEAIRAHVFTAERIHADDTTVPVLAKEKTKVGRLWAYVRDDRPFAGPSPPAAAFFYSPDRGGEHPERHLATFAGIMQADAYAGFNRLYEPGRQPGPILEAACWAHARRKLYELAVVAKPPIATEAVRRIDQLFAVEREISGLPAKARLAARTERSAPILAELEPWLRLQLDRLSRQSEVRKAIAYTTKRWPTLTRFMQRRPYLHDQQCGRAGAARRGRRPAQLDLRRLGPWRRAGRRDLHPDRDGQAERRRPPSLARRRPRPAARPPLQADRPAPAMALAHIIQSQHRRLIPRRQSLTAASAHRTDTDLQGPGEARRVRLAHLLDQAFAD